MKMGKLESLGLLSFATILAMLFGSRAFENGDISADALLFMMVSTIIFAIYILFSVVEIAFSFLDINSSGTKYLLAAFVFIFGYYGRSIGLSDVNSIFHVDSNALPMTTVAASILHMFSLFRAPIFIIFVFSSCALILQFADAISGKNSNNERSVGLLISMCFAFVFGLSFLVIERQLDDVGIRQKIFQTALMTDFSSSYDCQGIDEERYSVLFIGPNQNRVLVSPKHVKKRYRPGQAPFLQAMEQEIPTSFPIEECIPTTRFAEWSLSN